MPLDADADVVVVGFGLAGAAAALAAALDGARVLVLDRAASTRRPLATARAGGFDRAPLAGARALALAAGAEVRAGCRVHELVVAAGEVCGIGYATLPPRGVAALVHRWLRAAEDRAPATVAPALDRAAEAAWRTAFVVGKVSCSAVVLALDPRHWDFVGPAVWNVAQATARVGTPEQVPLSARGLRAVRGASSAVARTPELSVRRWCAGDEAVGSGEDVLRVDGTTGVVLDGGRPVPGLYSAVPAGGAGAADPHRAFAAGQRAGRGAVVAVGLSSGPPLLSVV